MNDKTIYQISPYYPPHLGGMEQYVKKITHLLHQKTYNVKVITSHLGNVTSSATVSALPSIELAHTPIIPALLFVLAKIPKQSLVHLHIAQAFTPEIVSLVCRLRKIPYIAHVHIDVGPSGSLGFLLPLYKKFFLSSVLKYASAVIALNKTQKEILEKTYTIQHIKIIPNAVDSVFFHKKIIRRQKRTRLLFVGRLSAQKNILKLLSIIEKITQPIELHIVGSGELEQVVKDKIATLTRATVRMHGTLQQKELISVYRFADICILPSEREGFPFVLLEAMASGLPVIANRIPEITEIAQKAVIYIDSNNIPEAANIIDTVIVDIALQQRLSQDGQALAKKYTWEDHIQQLESMYKTVDSLI